MNFSRWASLFPYFSFGQVRMSVLSPDQALKLLVDGNQRYVRGEAEHPNRDELRRSKTLKKQEPFAIILGCSDSRVSPEIIFDQGIGDLFIVRVAGNVAGPVELGSLEFSALQFHSSLILVLGHADCSAVKAVMNGETRDVEAIADFIQPAIDKARELPGDFLVNSVKMNIQLVVSQLKNNSVLSQLVKLKKLKIIGGYYDLESGAVNFFQ